MIIKTKLLISELKWAGRMDQLEMIAGDPGLVLTGGDPSLMISSAVALPTQERWSAHVSARTLLSYLSKVDDAEVNISTCGDEISITHVGGQFRVKPLLGHRVLDFPKLRSDSNIIRDLKFVLPRVLSAIPDEGSIFSLSGAMLSNRCGTPVFVSTDGSRMSVVGLRDSRLSGTEVFIPLRILQELVRMAVPDVELLLGDSHVGFRCGCRTIAFRKQHRRFPDFAKVLSGNFPHAIGMQSHATGGLLSRVKTVSSLDANLITLHIHDDFVVAFSHRPGLGSATGRISFSPCGSSAPPVRFRINVDHALDFVKLSSSFVCRYTNSDSPIRLSSENWDYIIATRAA